MTQCKRINRDVREFLNLDKKLKSVRYGCRLFHKLTTRSEKKGDLAKVFIKFIKNIVIEVIFFQYLNH